MRQIGRLANETDARRFAAYLLQQNIDSVMQNDGESWLLWVRNEDQLPAARESFQHFLGNPRDARYEHVERAVEFTQQNAAPAKRRRPRIRVRRLFGTSVDRPDTVVALIVITTFVTLLSWLPDGTMGETVNRVLSFADTRAPAGARDAFRSIKHGEIWRLVTPVFLHFRWDHILFNMVMFYYLGSQVERLRGPVALGLLFLLLAIPSNLAQAYFTGPNFGGMSGVVYGLLGYVWIKSSYQPRSGFLMDPIILVVSLAWLFLGLFAWQETIANYAHVGGFFMGILIGFAPSRRDDPPTEGVI